MAPRRKSFAIVEWEFMRFDPRYRALPSDFARMVYLHWWALAVHLRRDLFDRVEVSSQLFADMLGVDAELVPSMLGVDAELVPSVVESCISVGLAVHGPRGAIRLKGVRSKHSQLRGWGTKESLVRGGARLLDDCGPDSDMDSDSTETVTPAASGAGPDARVKDFEHWWGEEYKQRFGKGYICAFKADGQCLKAVLTAMDKDDAATSLDTLKAAAVLFLDDVSRATYGGYTIRGFVSSVNRYLIQVAARPKQDGALTLEEIEARRARRGH